MIRTGKKPRLTREEWLAKALDILAEDPSHLRIDEIASRLGVSKGSFYWHFENRSEFVHTLAEFWKDTNTVNIVDVIHQQSGSGEERLLALMKLIISHKAAKYDLAVRAWARHEPEITPVIRQVDRIRRETIRGLFADMGFEEPELTVRAGVFIVTFSFQYAMSLGIFPEGDPEQLNVLHAFFTRH